MTLRFGSCKAIHNIHNFTIATKEAMADAPRSATFPIASCVAPGHEGDITKKEAAAGILPSHGKLCMRYGLGLLIV